MATVDQSNRSSQPKERPSADRIDFICKPKYSNTLPDLPFEPKFLQCPFVSLSRFVKYRPTTLEKAYKYELLTEPDLNVRIDLIDPMTYSSNQYDKAVLHPKDEKLLEDESTSQQNTKRSLQHSKIVPWMRKTEYISTEFNRFGVGADRQESKIGYSIKKRFGNEQTYKDRDSQIKAINQTFVDIRKPAKKHYSKPGVHAVEEWSVLPDFEMWCYPFAQVIFDGDPLPYQKVNRSDKLTHSVIKGMKDSEGDHFVGYFSPTPAAIEQMLADEGEGEGNGYRDGFGYEYELEREFNWNVESKATKGHEPENYFFAFRNNTVTYNKLETRVHLKRRAKTQTSSNKKSILTIHHRPPIAKEQKTMDIRVHLLLYPYDAREEEEEEEEEEEPEQPEDGESQEDQEMEAVQSESAKATDATSQDESMDVTEAEETGVVKPSRQGSASPSADEKDNEDEEEEMAVVKKRKKSTAEPEDEEEEEEEESSSGSGSDEDESDSSKESETEGQQKAPAAQEKVASSSSESEDD